MPDAVSPTILPLQQANPCMSCGACCAFFRVSFHWAETTAGKPGGVPEEMTSQVTPHRVAMLGTLSCPARCTALSGTLGEAVFCTIHPARSTPCRDFAASWENGIHNPDCDRARAAHGLPPLEPGWWQPERDGDDHPDKPRPIRPRRRKRAA
ncbi:YkgJ family cysteine cluster protein [Haloferula sargassicola]|uniref:YkgJ family cysteine cluster protein n=1 Tax=Haloferula sargassicola TaxID=490096 RepID=A0ABP9UKH1_9BACT